MKNKSKNWWPKLSISILMAIVVMLMVMPVTVLAHDGSEWDEGDFKVIDITSDVPWLTGQTVNVDAIATDTATVTVTVQNVSDSWLLNYGRAAIDGIQSSLAGVSITALTPGWQMDNQNQAATFKFTIDINTLTQEGQAEVKVTGIGQLGIKLFGHYFWLDSSCFSGSESNVFGVDNTPPSLNLTIQTHYEHIGSVYHTWETVTAIAWDNMSGIKSVTESTVDLGGGRVKHIFIATDNAGNQTTKSVITTEKKWSYSGPSIGMCEHCWHSLVNVGDISGTGCFTQFAPGPWFYYVCPFCTDTATGKSFTNEPQMRALWKMCKDRGYDTSDAEYRAPNYKP